MKVLIVKASALGDIMHALPVLRWLHSADKHIEIHWLVEESFASLLESHPMIRKVHLLRTRAWRNQGWRKTVREVAKSVLTLRDEQYDVVLDLQGNSKSGLFGLFSGAPLRYGFDHRGVRELPNVLATNRKVSIKETDYHVVDRYLSIARAAFPSGKVDPTALMLPPDKRALSKIDELLFQKGLNNTFLIVLHYGTTWKTKLWSLDLWQELANCLAKQGNSRLLLTWGDDDEHRAALTIQAAAGEKTVIWPRGTLPELAALLKRADLVIGGDTGPVHIAAAVGTKTVSVYRVTDALRNGPRGPEHICLQAPCDCSPCLQKTCEKDAECARSIETDQVLSAIHQLLWKPETHFCDRNGNL